MNKKGHTLLELVITFGILGLLLSAVFQVFVPGLRVFMIGKDRAEVQCNVMVALKRISRELETSSNNSVTINSDDDYSVTGESHAISFLSAYKESGTTCSIALDYKTSTIPIWQKYIVYYYDRNSGQLRRLVIPLAEETTIASPISSEDLQTAIDNANMSATYGVVTKDISNMSICRTSPYVVRIEITSSKKGMGLVGSKVEEMTCFKEIFPHNTL